MNKIICNYAKDENNAFIKSISMMMNLDYWVIKSDYMFILTTENLSNAKDKTIINRVLNFYHTYEIKINKNILLKDLKLEKGKYIVFCQEKNKYDRVAYVDYQDNIYIDNDDIMNLKVNCVYKENELEIFKTWFDNKSFFGNNSFVLRNVENLGNIGLIVENIFINLVKDLKVPKIKLSKKESINIVKNYFDKHNIDIDIDELIKNENLVFVSSKDFYKKNTIRHAVSDGYSKYDKKEKKKKSFVSVEGLLKDAYVLVHELSHYRNEPMGKRNITSDVLTEAISYVNELIMCDDLKKEYKEAHSISFCRNIIRCAYDLYYPYKLVYVYKKNGNLDKDSYLNITKQDDYDKAIDDFRDFVDKKISIFASSYHLIGMCLGIYMFVKYKDNNEYFEKIEKFNNSINNMSMNKCLNIIGLKNIDDLVKRFETICLDFIKIIDIERKG